jgi:hypothetical protein
MGRAINDFEQNLAELTEEERPAKVVLVVVTDGQENASREFHKEQIEKMIKEKTEKSGWQFVFLSADLTALGDAKAVGIHADATLLFAKIGNGSARAWDSRSRRTSEYRSNQKRKIGFIQDDRQHPDDPEKRQS